MNGIRSGMNDIGRGKKALAVLMNVESYDDASSKVLCSFVCLRRAGLPGPCNDRRRNG